MKHILWITGLAVLLPAVPLHAQEVRTASGSENARIRSMANMSVWMGALVGEQEGGVIVGMLVRPTRGVDLRGGDVLQSVNGTRVRTVSALNQAFDAVPAGRPVQIAVRRDGQSVVIAFSKPAHVPRATVQTQRREPAPSRPRQ